MSNFSDFINKTMDAATKLKKVMIKKDLMIAKAKCPECGGWLHGRLAGPKKHLHMACETKNCLRMME